MSEALQQGREAMDIGEFVQAEIEFRSHLEAQPDNADGHFWLAEALAEQGRSDEAIACYLNGLKFAPADLEALMSLGDLHFEAGDSDSALKVYREVLSHGEVADAWVSIGLVHYSLERIEEAVSDYRKALVLEKDNVFALNSLGDALYASGDNEAACDCYKRVIALDPQDAQAHFNLAEMHYDSGELKLAEEECRAALRFDPGLSAAYLTLGNLHLDQEQLREAVTAYEEFLSRETSSAAHEIVTEVRLLLEGLHEQIGS